MILKQISEYLDNFLFKRIHYSITNEKNIKGFNYWEKIYRKKYSSLKQTSPGTVKQVKNLYFKKTTLENISFEISNHRTSKKTGIFLISLILLNSTSFITMEHHHERFNRARSTCNPSACPGGAAPRNGRSSLRPSFPAEAGARHLHDHRKNGP